MIDSESYDLCMETARVALARGDRHGAEQALRAAIRVTGHAEDARPRLAATLIRLGELKQAASSDAEAEEIFREALEVGERAFGPDDLRIVPALTSLGALRIARGTPEDAEPLLARALTISERGLGRDHPDLVGLLNDLSRLYLKQSAHAFAEPLLLRLHAIKRSKGEDHPEVATVLASLATVRQALGRHDAAEQLWRRVVEIRERTLAPNHFAIVTALEHLAETCAARAKLDEALRLFQRALAMRELTLGVEHPSLRGSRERIADLQLQASEESAANGEPEIRAATPPDRRLASGGELLSAAREAAPDPGPSIAPLALRREARQSIEPELPQRPVATQAAEPSALRLFSVGALGQAPASIIMPSFEHDLALEDEDWDLDADRALGGRGGAMLALAAFSRKRSTQFGAAGVGAVALLLIAMGTGSNAQMESGQVAFAQGAAPNSALPVAAAPASDPSTYPSVLAQEGRSGRVSDVARDANGALDAGTNEGARRPATADRSSTQRATSRTEDPASSPTVAPALPTGGARGLPRGASAKLDSVMRSVSVAPIAIGPGKAAAVSFSSSGRPAGVAAGSLESTKAAAPALIGDMPGFPFPSALRASGQTTGTVVVEFIVDTTGRPDIYTLTILKSDHELFSAAIRKVIPSMRFVPAQERGRKVAARVQMPIRFSVGRD